MVKRLIQKSFSRMGYEIHRISDKPKKGSSDFTTRAALQRCAERGVKIRSVIDVGASDSRWSRMCMDFYPDATYMLIEAQEEHKEGLEKFKQEFSNADYIISAAGDKEGKIFFDNSDLFGGLASYKPFESNCIEVPVVTIDKLISEKKLEGPFLIKLDTHGFEVPILEGAKNALKKSGLLVIETYNYKLTSDSLRYWEMCHYMEKLGFLSIEMCDLMLRLKDATFWQMDTFYVPAGREEFLYNAYK